MDSYPTPPQPSREERMQAKMDAFDARPKKCIKCGELKMRTEFGKHKDAADGRQSYCKACKNALGKRRRERNVSARLKHHMATRVTAQLGIHTPENLTRDLERYFGYPMTRLANALSDELREREGKKLRDALNDGYHIDHIKPLSRFKVISGGEVNWDIFQECWAISNLKAISAEENLAKGAKVLKVSDAN